MDVYRKFVRGFEEATEAKLPAPGRMPSVHPPKAMSGAPVALVFSPHPDDEAIIGALPLRLQREAGARVVNVAVTLGSNVARRKERQKEVEAACRVLGWDLEVMGLKGVTPETLRREKVKWARYVKRVREIIVRYKPRWIFYPHRDDGHPTHVGVNLLVEDALKGRAKTAPPWRVLTEYWHPMCKPNLLVECPPDNLAVLLAALCCHKGEIARNPYHLTLPAWMMDNVRRGAELVGGHGAKAPGFAFGALYRIEPDLPRGWGKIF